MAAGQLAGVRKNAIGRDRSSRTPYAGMFLQR